MTGTLTGYYVLDEDSGATAYDYSGDENHGSISGAGPQGTGTVIGPFGNSAYSFDGVDDNVTLGAEFYAGISSHSYWYNHQNNAKEEILGDAARGWHDIDHDPVNGVIEMLGSSGTTVTLNVPVQTNSWHHVVLAYDGATIWAYHDGVLADEFTGSGSGQNFAVENIGTGGNTFFTGYFSNYRIYTGRVLTPQEIQYLYQAGVSSELTFEETQP